LYVQVWYNLFTCQQYKHGAKSVKFSLRSIETSVPIDIQGGSNMTGTDLYVNKPHCAAAVRP